jgi:hypothetical protein
LDRQLLNRLFRGLEILLALVVVGYLGWLIYNRWLDVRDVKLTFELAPFLVGCVLLLAFNISYSFSWQTTLRLMIGRGNLPTSLDLHRAFFLSFITRYLPAGNVVNVGGRVELFKRLGGRRSKGLQSIYYEQLSLIVGVAIIGLIGLHFYDVEGLPTWLTDRRDIAILLLSAGAMAAYLSADLIIVHAPHWMRLDRIKTIWEPLSLGKKTLLLFQFGVVNLAQGAAVYWMLRAVYPGLANEPGLTYLAVSGYLVGRLVGQLAAFIPGGIGIREGAFTFLLSPYIPVQAAVVGASLFRLASMVMEAVIAGGLVLASRLRENAASRTRHSISESHPSRQSVDKMSNPD